MHVIFQRKPYVNYVVHSFFYAYVKSDVHVTLLFLTSSFYISLYDVRKSLTTISLRFSVDDGDRMTPKRFDFSLINILILT